MGDFIVNRVYVLVILILCGAAIIYGNLHWNHKISAQSGEVTSLNGEKNVDNEQTNKEKEKEKLDITKYTSNLPEDIQEKVENSVSSGKPLNLMIFGTHASKEEGSWFNLLSKGLKETYSDNVIRVTMISTEDKTTLDIVNDKSYEEINELQPDILLFEPSMLKDNGQIGINNTLKNIQIMIDSWQDANKELTLMIQPPNPLYAAKFYPIEVSQLKDYAVKNKINYINHWENWPGLEDEKMKSYLTKENEANSNGNKVWADYLLNYFIAE